MLCPRCNSENETGEKFCRHCGAPLTDTELFMSPKERKLRKKEKKREERKKLEKQYKSYSINVPKNQKQTAPKKTYSLNPKAYKRNPMYMLISLAKSLVILIILIVLVYFIGSFVLTKVAEVTDAYKVADISVPSVNFVVGDRDVKKVKYSYNKGIKVEYIFENVEKPTTDLTKYIAYLMEHNKFNIVGEYNENLENGSVQLKYVPETENHDTIIADINWTTNGYSIAFYKDK